ncbi:hypothetical protein M422DRAFT_33281 [Sphaerobolus stellatus SS14]|uniref:F-box domain-containing protein n=1 Tax=Sphaerobolus stellatus (strain SS14) TaxID=990650 RepID=A0A0C9VAC1_SPHS4|nr:hypothetical protein M422DRAFT_33281 [Sphaerobolus stellatus SS14]
MAEPSAVAAMAQSCTFFRNLINRPLDQHLWRSLYLARFDDPRATFKLYGGDPDHFPWSSELKQRVRTQTLLTRHHIRLDNLNEETQVFIFHTVASTIFRSPPVPLLRESQDLEWVTRVIGQGDALRYTPRTGEAAEYQAQLRLYLDMTYDKKDSDAAQVARTASRSFIYDLRKYSRANLWGPFLPGSGGRVNWSHLEHIYRVMAMNIGEILDLFDQMIPPVGLDAVRAYSAPRSDPTSIKDWAGIEGRWYRYVCFMDYRDLFAFNFTAPPVDENEPLNNSILEDDDFQEAIRLIELNLRVTDALPCPTHPHRPVLRFEGWSKGAQGNEARVKGMVFMTPDNQVRWKFVSVYDGRTQWSSEGVQIGGMASAVGVMGIWTGANHLEQDPVGPFWLFKVKDTEDSE